MEENELFEEYLNNRLPAEETAALEQRLQQDADLKERFAFYRTLHADMKNWNEGATGREQLKAALNRIAQTSETPVRRMPTSRRKLWIGLSAAASLALVFLLWRSFGPASATTPDTAKLFTQYSSDENLSLARGANADSLLEAAVSATYDKKYDAAIPTLEQYAQLPGNATTEPALFLGFCYLQTGQNAAAEKVFAGFMATDNPLKSKARWYQALLLLKTGRTADCNKLLDQIIASGDGYTNKARQLKEALQ
jgi:TolA-binding protein